MQSPDTVRGDEPHPQAARLRIATHNNEHQRLQLMFRLTQALVQALQVGARWCRPVFRMRVPVAHKMQPLHEAFVDLTLLFLTVGLKSGTPAAISASRGRGFGNHRQWPIKAREQLPTSFALPQPSLAKAIKRPQHVIFKNNRAVLGSSKS